MENIQKFIENYNWLLKFMFSVLIIIISIIIYNFVIQFIEKNIEKNKVLNSKKTKTYIRLIKSINRYIFIIIVLILLLKLYGINISSMLAGIGIISIIIGLAIQDFLKDIIRGISILSDNYFSVSDVVKYKDIIGKVLVIGLKTTKIQELSTNNIYSIANRNIEEITVLSKLLYVNIPLPYELKLIEQHKIVEDIVNIIKKDSLIENCENVGITELSDSKIEYQLRITVNQVDRLQARRNTLEHILEGLEKNSVAVPYNQIDIHQK